MMPGTLLLLRLVLMVDTGLRIWEAFAHQLPAAFKSKAGTAHHSRQQLAAQLC
jgi:hypothetical protein